ncbi:MAG: type II secretion system F family protein [Candidatus Portnoybacteria bacterium]|nr:type II secretion system F family protein [Candidatus Portnoybacteria bacterium]
MLYIYTAKTKEGETEAGQSEAANDYELAAFLRKQGLVLISAKLAEIEETTDRFNFKKFVEQFGHISLVEKMMFSRNLAIMIKAGLSLNQALNVLAQQTKSPKFKKIINQVATDIQQGKSFSESLAKHSGVFNDLYVNMVKIGETSGNLNEILRSLAEQMKKDHDLISRVRGAMIYPAVIITAMLGIGIIMMIVVVPKLTEVFVEMKIELPLSTRVIIGVSNFLQHNLIFSFIFLSVFIFFARLSMRIKSVKKFLHNIILHLPIFGSLSRKINSARFARNFSSLVESGVAIVKSLEITAGTLSNLYFKESLIASAQQVKKGKELSETLSCYTNLYAPMIIQMTSVGEKTGDLAGILNNLADFYEEEIDNITKNLSSIIEPIIMLVVGAAVGFFAISMIQPMYSMMGGV